MRVLSVAEQRYQAVLAVISDGRTVTETAAAVGVSRQTLHTWLARYEAGGLERLVDGSHRPVSHPRQMSPVLAMYSVRTVINVSVRPRHSHTAVVQTWTTDVYNSNYDDCRDACSVV